MGAKSTITISRSHAIGFIMQFIMMASNDTLASVVEDLNDQLWDSGDYQNSLGLHNFMVNKSGEDTWKRD